jgi:hypothetical protein
MTKKAKHILNSILFASTSILYFFLAYIGYGKQNIDLSKYAQYENVITDKGIDIHYGSKGKESNVFFISLKGLDEDLGVYRMSQNYKDLLEKVNVGDKIKVHYKENSNENENINIDLIQVEKDGEILIGKAEYENKESALIYIGLIAGIGTLFMAYRFYNYGSVFGRKVKNYR